MISQLLWSGLIALAIAPGPALAMLREKCGTDSCKSFTDCPPSSPDDIRAFACFAVAEGKTCKEALVQAYENGRAAAAKYALTNDDERVLRNAFRDLRSEDRSCTVSALVQAWERSALWVGEPQKGVWRHGVAVLPTVSMGLPVTIFGDSDRPAAKALNSTKTFAGVLVRYTPLDFWASLHGLVGTADALKTEALPAEYVDPAALIFGIGADVAGGMLSLTYMRADIRKDGLFSASGDKVTFLNLGIDLGAVILTLSGSVRAE